MKNLAPQEETFQMLQGPYAGQALNPMKRPVRYVGTQKRVLIQNIRKNSKWWSLNLEMKQIARIDLLGQSEVGEPENVHVMMRVRLHEAAQMVCQESGERSHLTDFILTVNPHEAVGKSTSGRQNGVHSVCFRIVPTEKLAGALRKNPQTQVMSSELHLNLSQKAQILFSFLAHSQELSGKGLFHYTQNNCSTHLWASVFEALQVESKELFELSRRGRNSFEIAKKLNLLTSSLEQMAV